MEALKGILEMEREAHLTRSVYSSDDKLRHESNGVVKWIDQFLQGVHKAHYTTEAEVALGRREMPSIPEGDPYMSSDGLGDKDA